MGNLSTKGNQELKGTLLVITAGVIWGTTGLFVRTSSTFGLSTLQIAAFRFAITALMFAIVVTVVDRSMWRISLRDLPLFLGIGVCSVAFFSVCYFTAIQMMPISTAAILLYTSPIWVMLMSVVFFKEKMGIRKLAGLILAFLGCVLVSGVGGSVTLPGFIIGLCSGIGYALYSVLGTIALRKYSSLTVTLYAMLFAAIATLAICDTPTMINVIATAQPPHDTLFICLFMVLMAFTTAMAPYLLYTQGLMHVVASKASIMATVEPISATILGIIFLGESLTLPSAIGILCVVGAIVVLNTGFELTPASRAGH